MTDDTTPVNPAQADQVRAAVRESNQRLRAMAATTHVIDPDRFPRPRAYEFKITEQRRRKVTEVIRAAHPCRHIRTAGPRPVTVWLALEIATCAECDPLHKSPPSDHDDRCDWCHTHGYRTFTPVAIQAGVALVIGDACPACAAELGCPS